MYQQKKSLNSLIESLVSQINIEKSWEEVHVTVNGEYVSLDPIDLVKEYSTKCFQALYSATKKTLPYDNADRGYFAECDTRELLYATLKELAERVYDAHARFFSEEILGFIRSKSDDEIGTWIAGKLKEPSDEDGDVGAYWCVGCFHGKKYGCSIEHVFLCVNTCNKGHGTKSDYIRSQLCYALPRELRSRVDAIAYAAYTLTIGS